MTVEIPNKLDVMPNTILYGIIFLLKALGKIMYPLLFLNKIITYNLFWYCLLK